MSYMRGDLLSKTRKLVKGLAKATPVWLKAMEAAPPVTFPRTNGEIKKIVLPEDKHVNKFNQNHPDSLYHDAIKLNGFDPPPSRVFAWRVVELKAAGVKEEDAMAVADMEYAAEKKAKKAAYKELKQINRIQGKKPPPNPYPSAIKEIQAEEKKLVRDRFFNPRIHEIVKRLKEEHPEVQAERDQYRHWVKPGSITVSADDNTYAGEWGNGNRFSRNNNRPLGLNDGMMSRNYLGDWNGAGAHVNFSTKSMRKGGGYEVIEKAIEKLSSRHKEHIAAYGDGNERRLTGMHETGDISKFAWGVADRGASVRVGRDTAKSRKGYFEDGRPASNMDPYVVTSMIAETTILNKET